MADPPLLTSLLREVSRSFYLTLRVLPATIRPQIGLAYLLARTTDTVADTELVAVDKRLEALEWLKARILGADTPSVDFGNLASHQGAPAERQLLLRCEESLSLLKSLSAADLALVRTVLNTITAGQELDLRRFGNLEPNRLVALETEEELDSYTYHVAGCVGEFWTRICHAHLFPERAGSLEELVGLGVRFGKGLQLVNILRDLPRDLRKGRCYLPANEGRKMGLVPEDLLDPANEPRVRPLYLRYVNHAFELLRDGWAYTKALPRRCPRVRLACAWPLLIGVETLQLLRSGPFLSPHTRIKVPRSRVRSLMFKSVVLLPFSKRWQALFPSAL